VTAALLPRGWGHHPSAQSWACGPPPLLSASSEVRDDDAERGGERVEQAEHVVEIRPVAVHTGDVLGEQLGERPRRSSGGAGKPTTAPPGAARPFLTTQVARDSRSGGC